MATVRKNEVGVPLRVETTFDLSEVTAKKLRVRKPRGALAEWTDVTVDGSTLNYITKAGDLNQKGEYRIVASIELAGGIVREGPPALLIVKEVFEL